MKKSWKILIICEIIIVLLFFAGYFFYEQNWIEENTDYSNMEQPIINQKCKDYNINLEVNPNLKGNDEHIHEIP